MPAFVASNATWNTTAGNKTVGPTPAVGELIVVVVAASGMTTGLTVSDNQTGGTYTQIGTFALGNTSADCIGIFVRNNLVASAVVHTITAGESTSTGGGLAALRFSGMTRVGLAAVTTIAGVQQFAKQQNQAAGTPAPAFPGAASTLNAVIGAVLTASNSTVNTVPPTGWTEQHDLGFNTPTTGIEVATRDSGETGTTITWGGATPSIFASLIIELEAGVPDAELIAAEPNYNGLGRVSAFLDDEDAEHYDYYAPLHNATEAAIAGPPVGGGGPSDAELVAADPNYSGAPRIGATLDDVDDEPYDYYGGSAPVVDTTLIIAPRMQAWIDFGDPSLLFTDTARTTPVAVANDLIRGVTDKSGNGQHLAQATNPPTYQPNAYRGLSASRWDGFAQKLQGPVTNSGFGYPQPITRIAVVRSTEVSAASRVAIGGQTATDPAGPWTFTGLWSAWAGSPTLSDGAQDNALHVITTVFNGGSSSIALEGIVKVTGTTGSGVVTRYEVGSYNDGTQLWLGDVCEFIDFQGILDPADLAYWVNYMVTRWSVLTEVEFTPDQYPYETEPEHDYYSPLYDGAADAYTAGPPIVANDSYVAAVDTFDHSDQPDEDEAFDFYSQRFDGAVEAFIAGAPPPVINQSVDEVGVRWFTVSGINVSETGLRAPNGITDEVGRRVSLLSPETVTTDDSYIATNSFLGEQDTAYQADVDDEHYNFYAQRLDGSVEAFIAGPPVVADDYVATAASVLPDRGWDEADYYPELIVAEMVDGAEAVLGFLTVEDEIANAAQLDPAAGQDDDAWWTLTDPTDIAPFVEQAEAITGFLTVEDEIAEAAQLDRSVGQDDDQAWLAGDPTDVAPFIDGAEAILGFLTIEDEIAEAAQLPRDIGWFSEDFDQANDPTDITPFLDEQEELIAGPPLFADDGYIATVDVFDHSDEPAPDDAFDFYATTQEGTEWSIGFLAPDVEITIGAQPSRGEDTGLDNPDWDYTDDQSYVEQTEAVVGFLAPDAEITEAAQLDRSVGQDDDQAWIVTDPTDVWPFTDQGEAVIAGPPTSDDFVALLAPHVESVAQDFPERIDDTEEQSVETAHIQPEEFIAGSTVADDPLYLAQTYVEQDVENLWPDDEPTSGPVQPWVEQAEAYTAGPPSADDSYIATTALVPDASDQPAPDEAFDFYAYPIEASEWFVGFLAPDAEIADAAHDHTVGQDDDQLWTLVDPTDAAPFVDGIEYLTGFLVPADEIAQAAQPHYGDWQDWRETEQTEDYANDSTIGVEDTTNAPDTFDLTAAAQPDPSIGQDWHLWPEWDYTADQPYASELDVAPLTFPADSDEVTQAAQPTAIGQDDDALWTLTDPTDIAPFTEQAEGFIAGPPDVFDTTIATQPDPSMGQDTDLLNPPDLSQLDTGYVEQAEGYVAGPPAFAPDAEAIASQPAETGIDVEGRWPEWDGTDATPFLDGAEWFIGFTVPDVEITIAAQPSRAEDTAIDNPDRIEWTEETDPAATLDLSPLVRADDPIEVTLATQLDASVGQDDDQWWTLLDPTDTTPFIDEQEEAIAGSTPADDPLYAAQAWPDVSTTEYAPEETTDYANDTARDLSALTPAPDSTDTTFAAQLDPSAGQDDDQGWIAADPTDIWPFTDQLEAFEEIVTPDEGIAATQDYSDAQYEPEALWAPESLSDGAIEFIASDIEQALLPAATALCEPAAEPEDEAWPIYLALSDQSGEFAATQLDVALVAALDVPAALVDEPEVWTPEVALADGIEVATTEIAVAVAAQPLVEAYDWTIFEEPVADLSTIERRPIVARPTAQPDIVPMVALVDPGVDLVALKDPEVGFPEGGGFSSGFSSGFARGGGTGELDALAESEGYAMGPYGAPAPDHVSALEGEVEQIDALSDPDVDVT